MKVRLDENLSYRVANAIRALLLKRSGLHVDWVGDIHPPGTSDPSWIRQFAENEGDAVISGDANILQHWPDLIAYRESGLIAFFPPPRFANVKGFSQAALILHWWPAIIEKIKVSDRGDAWRLPWSWSPAVNAFDKLDDPRFKTDSVEEKRSSSTGRKRQFRPGG